MPYKGKEKEAPEKKIQSKYILVILFIVFLLAWIALNIALSEKSSQKIRTCGDGTFYDTCSLRKPYFCEEGILVEKASICGCNDILNKFGDSCFSKYQTNPKDITLNYILRGEEREIVFTVYGGMGNYLPGVSRAIYYEGDERPSRADFKLKSMNEEEQREFLLPLVTKIQSITRDEEDQVRIAISLVQSIPYGFSEKTISFAGNQINYSRYPYEVLYENQGICGEKSALLAFLLREIGYEIVFFYHALENHESLGIRCPVEQSLDNTGYCFIETTAPSIITDNSIEYVGGITLNSEPQVILISKGASIGSDWYEYEDAGDMKKIRGGEFLLFKNSKLNNLKEKYGLVEIYNPA